MPWRNPPSRSIGSARGGPHVSEIVALDFFAVPTVSFRVLFVLIVLAHDRRGILRFNVTAHPTAEWTAQQLVEAFPWDRAPR